MKNILAVLAFALASATAMSAFAETYSLDPAHSSVLFRVKHNDLAYVYGMFLKSDATVEYDKAKPEATKVEWTVDASSVFTNNKKRDDHLKSPDFLDVKQFPTISFKSKKVKKAGETSLRVTGDLTLHGVTREVTTVVEITGEGKGQKGEPRIGMFSSFDVKRTDFGMKTMVGVASDRIHMVITFEGAGGK